MASKMSQTALWVPVRSLPWVQHKRWIPIGLMRCVHTHRRRPKIKGGGSLNHVRNIVKKIGEDNRKVGKISWTTSQTSTWGLKHDKIRTQWASSIHSKSMLKKVWCKCSKMESWRWTIWCPTSCSKGRSHTYVGGGKSHLLRFWFTYLFEIGELDHNS
jgi:hypothetical protein